MGGKKLKKKNVLGVIFALVKVGFDGKICPPISGYSMQFRYYAAAYLMPVTNDLKCDKNVLICISTHAYDPGVGPWVNDIGSGYLLFMVCLLTNDFNCARKLIKIIVTQLAKRPIRGGFLVLDLATRGQRNG